MYHCPMADASEIKKDQSHLLIDMRIFVECATVWML